MIAAGLAQVDRLRALPRPMREALYRRLRARPGALATRRYNFGFWARPEQALPGEGEAWTIDVSSGERGSGKTWRASMLFNREIFSGRAKRPRIIAATDPAIEATVLDGPSGIRTWLPPHLRPTYVSSTGYAGELLYPNGVKVLCCSASAPGQAIGLGVDLDFRDDPAGWVETCGVAKAERAWREASKSTREGLGRAIVATTPAGVEFLGRLLRPGEQRGVHVHQLGAVEANRGNLSPAYLRDTVADLRAAGEWGEVGDSPFKDTPFHELRVDWPPRLVAFGVWIDPATSTASHSCEVGVVGVGIDAAGTVYGLADRTAVMSAALWPDVALELFEELAKRYPGAEGHLGIEINKGGEMGPQLLRQAEKLRRIAQGKAGVSVYEIREVHADKSKTRRAVPVARLAPVQLRMRHGLHVLEGQLRNLRDDGGKTDGADAFVHGALSLANLEEASEPDARATFSGFTEQRVTAPTFAGGGARAPGDVRARAPSGGRGDRDRGGRLA